MAEQLGPLPRCIGAIAPSWYISTAAGRRYRRRQALLRAKATRPAASVHRWLSRRSGAPRRLRADAAGAQARHRELALLGLLPRCIGGHRAKPAELLQRNATARNAPNVSHVSLCLFACFRVPFASSGVSDGLIILWSWVRVPAGPPRKTTGSKLDWNRDAAGSPPGPAAWAHAVPCSGPDPIPFHPAPFVQRPGSALGNAPFACRSDRVACSGVPYPQQECPPTAFPLSVWKHLLLQFDKVKSWHVTLSSVNAGFFPPR